ncbi:uncharacterized protein LOC107042524 [Diachasma alloeum]|uniref:uncharacterized protein LOC107042524 n=1 Tax=Diachasma alloeum TaxID=454923 RepID=UPI00073844B1|nr:uncharacterized protein LOC107042524 [Diachasma alloeum]
MTDNQWKSLVEWYEKKILANRIPIMPKVYEEQPHQPTTEVSKMGEGQESGGQKTNGNEGRQNVADEGELKVGDEGVEVPAGKTDESVVAAAFKLGNNKPKITNIEYIEPEVQIIRPTPTPVNDPTKSIPIVPKRKIPVDQRLENICEKMECMYDTLIRVTNIQINTSRGLLESQKSSLHELREEKAEQSGDTSDEVKETPNQANDSHDVDNNEELAAVVENIIEKHMNTLKSQINSQNRGTDTSDAKLVADAIRLDIMNKGPSVKRDNKLDNSTRFEHFYDYFKSEVRSHRLMHVIDPRVDFAGDQSTLNEHKFKVVSLDDPVEILIKLKEIKRYETNVSSFTVRKEISNMKYIIGKMTASEFSEKFEDAIRKYENATDAVPLSDEEKRNAFSNAIMGSASMVRFLQSAAELKGEQPPNYEQLKLVVMQDEAARKQTNDEAGEVRAANLVSKDDRCFECGGFGHLGRFCPGKGKGKLCYKCKEYGHINKECPNSVGKDLFQTNNKAMLWHVRLGYASLAYLKAVQLKFPENKELRNVVFDESIMECKVCLVSKFNRLPFPKIRTRASEPLQIIYSDVMGPISLSSHPKGYRYISVFIDDKSRFAMAYPMRTKGETGHCLEMFVRRGRNLLGYDAKVCYLRSDQNTEFTGGHTVEVLKRLGAELQLACPDTPEHNGVAERYNQTIQKKVRVYMFDAKLPESMWDLALSAAAYSYNHTPHKSNEIKTPLEEFAPGHSFDVGQVKRLGSLAYIKVQRKVGPKFGAVGIRGVLVGYTPTGYILLVPEEGKFYESRHVRFNGKKVYGDKYKKGEIEDFPEVPQVTDKDRWFVEFEKNSNDLDDESKSERVAKRRRGRPRKIATSSDEKQIIIPDEKMTQESAPAKQIINPELSTGMFLACLSQGELELGVDKSTDESCHALLAGSNSDPANFTETMQSVDEKIWVSAVEEEFKSMSKNNVWKIVDRPISSLLYLAGTTRPDISYAVNVLSRHQVNPTDEDCKMVKRVLRYLRGTSTLGLRYAGKKKN